MEIGRYPEGRDEPERFAKLRECAHAWLAGLEATQAEIQRHLDSPMARLLLLENEATTASSDQNIAGSEDDMVLLLQLEGRPTQEQICEVLARGNGSTVDLKDAAVHIRQAGLSEAKTDRGLIKNLGSRLLESGRWARVRPAVYKLKEHPVAEGATAGVVDGEVEPFRSKEDDSEEGMWGGTSPDTRRSDESSCSEPTRDSEPSLSEIGDSS